MEKKIKSLNDFENLIDNLTKDAIINPLTGDEFIDSRLKEYGQQANVIHPYYSFFYKLAKKLEPKTVVELGAWQGTSACCFAAGYLESKVITIDHHGDPGDLLNEQKCLEAINKYQNLTYLKSWTWDALPTIKGIIESIDILFIDSWHDYEHAMRDYLDYSPLLSEEALLICDDIIGGYGPVISGMLDFWNELPEPKFLNNELHVGYPMGFVKW